MWKMSFLAIILATVFLGGCNWGDEAVEDRPAEDVNNDVRQGVDKVEDALDPNDTDDAYDRDARDIDRGTDGTVNENIPLPEATTPGVNTDLNGTNGFNNVPNANGVDRNGNVINEKGVEEKVDVRERNDMNTR